MRGARTRSRTEEKEIAVGSVSQGFRVLNLAGVSFGADERVGVTQHEQC